MIAFHPSPVEDLNIAMNAKPNVEKLAYLF